MPIAGRCPSLLSWTLDLSNLTLALYNKGSETMECVENAEPPVLAPILRDACTMRSTATYEDLYTRYVVIQYSQIHRALLTYHIFP